MKVLLDNLFGERVQGLQKSMELTWKRNEAIASNIANAETPGYRAVELDFAGELDKAFNVQTTSVTQTNSKHMDIGDAGVSRYVPDYSGVTKPDGNNVDIDIQMGQLAQNRGKYQTAATFMRNSLAFIGNVVKSVQ